MSEPTRKLDLRLLVGGRWVTDTGSMMQMAILPLYILDQGGTAATMGSFLLAAILPMMVLAPFAGVFGDRHNRKRVMISCDLISAGLALTLLVLASSGMLTLALLFVLQALLGISQIFFETSTGGMIPALVKKADLASANSKIAIARILATIAGPVIGANCYVLWGIEALFAVNALSFFLSALTESYIAYRHQPRSKDAQQNSLATDLKDGVLFVVRQRLILTICLFFAVITFTIGPVLQLTVPLVYKTVAQLPGAWYGYLQNFSAVGGLLGSIFAAAALKKFGFARNFVNANVIIIFSLLGFSVVFRPETIAFFGTSTLAYFFLFGLCLLVLTSSFIFISIPVQTLIQQSTPPEYLSRVYSLVGLISKGGMPIGAYIYGLVLAQVAVHQVVFITALLLLPMFVLFSVYLMRQQTQEKLPA